MQPSPPGKATTKKDRASAQNSTPEVVEEKLNLGDPVIPMTVQVDVEDISRPDMMGRDVESDFECRIKESGLLVGLVIHCGKSWGGSVQNLQPVFQVDTEYVLGKRYGEKGGKRHVVLAKPGYVIFWASSQERDWF